MAAATENKENCPIQAFKDKTGQDAPVCTQCISGSIHKGLPKGTIEKLHGLDTYVIGNRESPRGIIVMYTDIFGLSLPNNRLIADSYAQSGEWLVYVPDFFEGDHAPLKFADVAIPVDAAKQSKLSFFTGLLMTAPSGISWLMRHKDGPTDKTCMDFLESLRRETLPTGKKIGMVGMCWGGRYSSRATLEKYMISVDDKRVPLVDAGVALHPSNMVLPDDAQNMVVPFSYGWGEKDTNTKIELCGKVKELQAEEAKAGRKVPEVEHKIYTPGRHGFAVRGNPDDPAEKKCLEDSVQQVLTWFDRWL
ncbi:dienelactone hydrolase [Microdochium trichocladiopsis]|uniref:Dienelactone hydrolase n=1 Tax=Microdochium trichocladiopsis TaxID=1682393 RepID=A0A9P8Y015_9PEZI|nr:dienelactone hydrolase [Microdochium trichocladiopsis]KAH7024366.1 dienelactone hydrolase [Microdochium trichocladiopsis]